jgi:PAS domain S-box-containing protein
MTSARSTPASSLSSWAPEAGTARILTSDDRPEMVAVIEQSLGDHYDCEFAPDIDHAREMLAAGAYDLLLCDLHPPADAAIALAEEIVRGIVDTAVILVAEHDDDALAKRAFDFGAYGYVVKPPWPGQLLMTVMNALRRHQLELVHREHSQNQRDQRQAIIDMAPMPIYAKDLRGRYVLANASLEELAGVGRGEMVGLKDDAFLLPKDADEAVRADRRVFDSGTTYEATDVRLVAGVTRTFKTVKFPLLDEDGEIIASGGISPDITAELEAANLREELLAVQAQAIDELELSRQETVERLTRAIDRHDSSTGEHVNRMAAVAAMLGRELGLDAERADLLRLAAPMHDVGKIGTPDEILRKPGPLNAEERRVMENHTWVGHEILVDSQSQLLQLAATIALTHHERYDGSGYPQGLVGQEIPVEGRITAVADAFDALLSDRVYRSAMSVDQTMQILKEGSGTRFDPEIIDLLLAHLERALEVRIA